MFQPWPRKAVCSPEHSQGWTFVCPLEPGPERVSAKASFARFTEKWYSVRFANKAPLSFLSISQQPENLLVRENVLINSLLKYNSAWWEYFPVPSVTFFSSCFVLNYSPIKINQFEGHFMKLQADSNYLLSKEYEVPCRPGKPLHPPVAFTLQRDCEVTVGMPLVSGEHSCVWAEPLEQNSFSEAGLSWKRMANSVLSDQWERVNTFQCDAVHCSACLGGKVVWKRVLGLCISVLLHACPGAWYLWPLNRICRIVLRPPLM